MRKREFTPEELDWLRENYPITTDYVCRTHLHICNERLLRLVAEMGLQKRIIIKERKPRPKVYIYLDDKAPGGFCMDCNKYVPGGQCGRNGKEVGALWIKRCFV